MSLVPNKDLYNALSELKVVGQKQLDSSYEESNTAKISLEKILVDKDLISDENLGKILADLLKVPFIGLSSVSVPEEVLRIVPEIVAKKQKIIAFKKDERGLHLAMANPGDKEIVKFIEKKTGLPVLVYYATENDFQNSLILYNKNIQDVFEDIIEENVEEAQKSKSKESDPPIIKIVEAIVVYASKNRASDVHIEAWEDKCLVRFRIDGILHDVVTLPNTLHSQVVTRIKVLAKLRTDEHQIPQDGKIEFKSEEENLDIRVSVVPVTNGEKAVLRLLSERSRRFSLVDLGLEKKSLEIVEKSFTKPYGMILSTGPTGCGKTTTLYAILKLLNQRNINITTIEDPVEYEIQGVNQIQVNVKTGLTFANGLRSIVRQDPNIILVGEIRDEETAGIAVNAAMTGHLVLSTLHTNDAATAVPRLLDMEVEPFLIASSINVVVAQRLVRKLCLKCRYSEEIGIGELCKSFDVSLVKKHFENGKNIRIYKGKGCSVCHNTGYADRVGIFEVMEMTDEVKEAVVGRKDAGIIKKIAVEQGMKTMIEDGLEKIKMGITTIEEVIRATKQ